MTPSLHSRALGAIWGTCVADALGGPIQFKAPGTFTRIKGLEFVEPHKKPAGSYSDDGSMTLALAQSFIDSAGKYNHRMSIEYFVQWWSEGRFSTTKKAWDVGKSTRTALARWKRHGVDQIERTQRDICSKLDQESCSGNGSLMRIAPIGVALWTDSDLARKAARENSQVTHPALACVEACDAFTNLICSAMSGQDKNQMWQAFMAFKFTHPALVEQFSPYKTIEDLTAKSKSDITSSGWVVHTLEAALWGFFKYDTWEKGALAVVNLGGDSDTVGAVYGALAGVFYGYESIPERWINGMQNKELIQEISGAFAGLVSSQTDG